MGKSKSQITFVKLVLGPMLAVLVVSGFAWQQFVAPLAARVIYSEALGQVEAQIPIGIMIRSANVGHCDGETVQKQHLLSSALTGETAWGDSWEVESMYDRVVLTYPLNSAPKPIETGQILMEELQRSAKAITSSLKGDSLVVEYQCGRPHLRQ